MMPTAINRKTLQKGLAFLQATDPDLARLIDTYGAPPLRNREPGFRTLVLIILEQQVSLASAKAAFHKLAGQGEITPARFLSFPDRELKSMGFSRQKAGYCRGLATALLDGKLDLDALRALSDAEARSRLMTIKGIGPWTADIYLLSALHRPDIWPQGDLALVKAVKQIKQLPGGLDPETFEKIGHPWKPWRAVAARVLWHFYLNDR